MNCHNCGKPKATPKDFEEIKEGEGEHLCWSDYRQLCDPLHWQPIMEALETRLKMSEANLRRARLFLMKEHYESFDEPGILIDIGGHDRDCSECQFLRETRE